MIPTVRIGATSQGRPQAEPADAPQEVMCPSPVPRRMPSNNTIMPAPDISGYMLVLKLSSVAHPSTAGCRRARGSSKPPIRYRPAR